MPVQHGRAVVGSAGRSFRAQDWKVIAAKTMPQCVRRDYYAGHLLKRHPPLEKFRHVNGCERADRQPCRQLFGDFNAPTFVQLATLATKVYHAVYQVPRLATAS